MCIILHILLTYPQRTNTPLFVHREGHRSALRPHTLGFGRFDVITFSLSMTKEVEYLAWGEVESLPAVWTDRRKIDATHPNATTEQRPMTEKQLGAPRRWRSPQPRGSWHCRYPKTIRTDFKFLDLSHESSETIEPGARQSLHRLSSAALQTVNKI